MSERLKELDSIRGLAALTVVLSHTTIVIPAFAWATWGMAKLGALNAVKYSPLHLAFAGHEAVITFFVLSGFVLSIPFHAGRAPGYVPFAVKRICRIYVPYLAAVMTGLLAMAWLTRGLLPGLSPWPNQAWRTPLSAGLIAGHLLLVGSFNNGPVDPVIWSLVYEMRISLIFPLLMIAVLQLDWRLTFAGAGLLAVVGFGATMHFLHTGFPNDYFTTLQYLPMFVVGALLAGRRTGVRDRYRRLPAIARVLWLPAAIMLYTFQWWALHGSYAPVPFAVNDWVVMAGATMFIVQAIADPVAGRFLRTSPLVFLGRISYSLYLFHAIVLLLLLNLLYGRVPLVPMLALAPALSVGVAALAHRWVEEPSMRWGRRLAASFASDVARTRPEWSLRMRSARGRRPVGSSR